MSRPDFTPRPKSLRDLGVTPPRGWDDLVEGERMDWLQNVMDAAAREFRRIDAMSFEQTRENLRRLRSANAKPWAVVS